MNIEEERKVFVENCIKLFEYMPHVYLIDDKGKFETPLIERMFSLWLAAKAHVATEAEALKPTVKIKSLKGNCNYPWMLVEYKGETVIGRVAYFVSVADAKVWAQANGYRVIE